MIIKRPLTPEQIDALKKPSPDAIQKAQDDLFMYLFNRVNALEEKLAPTLKKSRKSVT